MRLTPPATRYITGKNPSHSTTNKLGTHFSGLDLETMIALLSSAGAIKNNKPTKRALELGLLDSCHNSVLWNLAELEKLLKKAGLNPQRRLANQELPNIEPGSLSSLSTIASYFDVSGATVGKWLKELGYRDDKGVPIKKLLKDGVALKVDYKDGNQKREFYKWDVLWALEKLQASGHAFDFDYEKSLKATGQNSSVTVTTIEDRARELAKEFVKYYNNPDDRWRAEKLIDRLQPDMITRIEKILKRPNWLSRGDYKNGL